MTENINKTSEQNQLSAKEIVINAEVRKVLKRRLGCVGQWEVDTLFIGGNPITGIGAKYRFYVPSRTIYVNRGENMEKYKMDDETFDIVSKRVDNLTDKREMQEKILEGIRMSTFVLGFIIAIAAPAWIFYNGYKEKKQRANYTATIPNWNDSIRMAKTDADLQRYINKREQQRLQLESEKNLCR